MGVSRAIYGKCSSSGNNTTILIKQRFGYGFSFPIFKELFSYGWKLLVTQLIDRTFNEIRGMAIGKMFSRSDLAFYQKGQMYLI